MKFLFLIILFIFLINLTTIFSSSSSNNKARCEFDSNIHTLHVNYQGNSSILCNGIGIKCFKKDFECFSKKPQSMIYCSSKNELSCIGDQISCSINGELSCKVDFPNNQSTITPIPTQSPTPSFTPTPTQTPTPSFSPTPTPSVTPTSTPLPNNCTYNGIDYSQFKGNYSSSDAPNGKIFIYYWNICEPSKYCSNKTASACQYGSDPAWKVNNTMGSMDLGYTFTNDSNQNTVLTYKTNSNTSSPCGSPGAYFYRQFKITFECSNLFNNTISVGKVNETTMCNYSVSMKSSSFCKSI